MRTEIKADALSGFRGLADREYLVCVLEIIEHPAFLELSRYRHHDATILDHVLKVSWVSWRLCGALGWRAREAARGGLLHDFFLYDWHDANDPAIPEGHHAFAHPRVAVANSRMYFKITEREENIIARHMWPVTLIPPRYKEAWVISVVDKLVAAAEFLNLAAVVLSDLADSLRCRARETRSSRRLAREALD